MINAQAFLSDIVQKAMNALYSIPSANISFQKTRKEFEGDFTMVTFPFVKDTKRSPEKLGQEIGEFLLANNSDLASFNVVKGFLNISLANSFWLGYFNTVKNTETSGIKQP